MKSYWLNLPVEDVQKAASFYKAIGFEINENHGDEKLASVMVGKQVICLFQKEVLKGFMKAEVTDTSISNEVIISFDLDTEAEVDELVEKINKAGGKVHAGPSNMNGYYGCLFTDLDGHRMNVIVM